MFAAAADDQQQTSPVGVAPLENRREVPVAGRSPDQRRSFERRGKPLVVHERGLGLDVFALIRPNQHCGECVAASRAPKLVEDMVVPRHSADCGESLEMLAPGIERRQQQENEIHRPLVDRLILHRLRESHEQAIDPSKAIHLAVGDRHAMAESGRTQLLALCHAGQYVGRVDLQPLAGKRRHLLQQRPFIAGGETRTDRVEIYELM
jgi:hypothetical protein